GRRAEVERERARLEEALLLLLADVSALDDEHRRLAERVPAKRPETRRRLLGRLQRAKEMIDDHQGHPPPLEALAEASALSVFHFLRLFTATFGLTPIAYADRRRVGRAKQLLRSSRLTVAETTERLGLASPSSVAQLLRRHIS